MCFQWSPVAFCSYSFKISFKGVQGNFFNGLIYADYSDIESELNEFLKATKKFNKYIFNLSHGIFPDFEVEKVKFVIEKVHAFSRS
ncbi:MAG: hypothetical protein KAJ18_03590, partial [Candidatus Omnitrophica bacterium]|nr:hypothetical protein [Candidatus Omnitrophota bacterium]